MKARVDTGASDCLFDRRYADIPGIEVESGLERIYRTVTGSFRTFGHEVALGTFEMECRAVARAPLPETEQGIVITAGPGNFVALERAGVENKEFGPYLFDEIDVPALEDSSIPIVPYDASRSLQLNLEQPVAAVLVGFIGSKLEQVRAGLVRQAKEARKTEEARRLEIQAQQIAELLNRDFNSLRDRLSHIRAVAARPGTAGARFGGANRGDDAPESWISGTQEPGRVEIPASQRVAGSGSGRDGTESTCFRDARELRG